jgi:hypothetical protein
MNWLGSNPLSLLSALGGAGLGLWVFGQLQALGHELPLCVGVCAGLACAASTREINLMRGLIAGTLAAWAGATAHVVYVARLPLWPGLAGFHTDLDTVRLSSHVFSIVLAVLIGGNSLRRESRARIVGS